MMLMMLMMMLAKVSHDDEANDAQHIPAHHHAEKTAQSLEEPMKEMGDLRKAVMMQQETPSANCPNKHRKRLCHWVAGTGRHERHHGCDHTREHHAWDCVGSVRSTVSLTL